MPTTRSASPRSANAAALQTLANHVRDFAAMMDKLSGADLPQWMAKVLADDLPGLSSFVKGVQRDLAAVTAGLTLPGTPAQSKAKLTG